MQTQTVAPLLTKKGVPDKRRTSLTIGSPLKKLMTEDIQYIISQVASGRSQYSLSKQFEVSRQRISQIIKGQISKKHLIKESK